MLQVDLANHWNMSLWFEAYHVWDVVVVQTRLYLQDDLSIASLASHTGMFLV